MQIEKRLPMNEYARILRVLKLISSLRSESGVDKKKFARENSVTLRSVDRYIKMLSEDLNMPIQKVNGRFKTMIEKNRNFNHSDYSVFTITEVDLIREALENAQNTQTKSIIQKLYALSDLETISNDFGLFNYNHNLLLIKKAMKEQKQIVLKEYASANSSSVKDRLVEPIKFGLFSKNILALDTEDLICKHFKIERISSVEISNTSFQFSNLHTEQEVDDFGMSSEHSYKIKLKLNIRAANLLKEEYPSSAKNINEDNVYQAEVKSLEAVGRFCLGFLGEVQVLEGTELQQYIHSKIAQYKV